MAKNKYGGSIYDQEYMTEDELRRAAEIRAAAERGDTTWDDAHRYVEDMRSGHGYSGGQDGSGFTRTGYVSPYQSQIDSLWQQISQRKPFSYDAATDPLYQQYEKQYTRSGQRAMQDTLAQLSARTGGLASSYAGQASQQTYDGYMQQLADKIPELQQAAYNMYLNEGDRMNRNLSTLMNLDNVGYGRFSDNRSFDYGAGRDAISDARYEDETAYNRNLQQAQTMAQYGDFSGYRDLGYTDDQIAKMQAAYQLQNQPRVVYRNKENEDESGEKNGRITSASQLGDAAMAIANAMSRSNSQSNTSTLADRINDAWKSGKITPEEADFLYRAIGF